MKKRKAKKYLKQQILSRNIRSLYHYSSTSSLVSILKHGIYSSQKIRVMGLSNNRGLTPSSIHQSYISLFVNKGKQKMLSDWLKSGKDKDCIIIELDPKVIYKRKTMFFPTDATNKSMKRISPSHWDTTSFDKMFEHTVEIDTPEGIVKLKREQLSRKPYETTCNMAEVKVYESIPKKYIKNIYISSPNVISHLDKVKYGSKTNIVNSKSIIEELKISDGKKSRWQ